MGDSAIVNTDILGAEEVSANVVGGVGAAEDGRVDAGEISTAARGDFVSNDRDTVTTEVGDVIVGVLEGAVDGESELSADFVASLSDVGGFTVRYNIGDSVMIRSKKGEFDGGTRSVAGGIASVLGAEIDGGGADIGFGPGLVCPRSGIGFAAIIMLIIDFPFGRVIGCEMIKLASLTSIDGVIVVWRGVKIDGSATSDGCGLPRAWCAKTDGESVISVSDGRYEFEIKRVELFAAIEKGGDRGAWSSGIVE